MSEEEGVACAAGVETGVYVEEAVSLHIASASALSTTFLQGKGENYFVGLAPRTLSINKTPILLDVTNIEQLIVLQSVLASSGDVGLDVV